MFKKNNKKIFLKIPVLIFIFLLSLLVLPGAISAGPIGEECTTFEDCPPNNMCISTKTGGDRKCYPKIGGGCNNNTDCSYIEKNSGIPGAFCDSTKAISNYSGSCFSNKEAPKTTTDSGCSWRIEKPVPGATGTFQGGCYSIETESNWEKCSSISQPEKKSGEKLLCCCGESGENINIKNKTPDLNPLGNLQIKIPGLDEIAEKHPIKCEGEGESQTCKIPWIAIYIHAIYNYFLAIAGILAAIALMVGGVIWLVSAGNASRVSEAKSWITGSITGLVILLTSYVLLYQINPELVGMRYVKLAVIDPMGYYDTSVDETNENPYIDACLEAKKDNLGPCKALGETKPSYLVYNANYQKYIHPETLDKFTKAMECVRGKNNGDNLFSIVSAWRSPAKQIEMKEYWIAQGKPDNAAPPCCSNHSSGRAIDIYRISGDSMVWDYNETSGLKECMNNQGLYANISGEPWHWSPTGK